MWPVYNGIGALVCTSGSTPLCNAAKLHTPNNPKLLCVKAVFKPDCGPGSQFVPLLKQYAIDLK